MNEELKTYLKNLALEQLMESELGEKLETAMGLFEKVQSHLYALSEKQGEEGVTTLKVATVMTFAVLKKIGEGKTSSKLTEDDWKDISKEVSEFAILPDDQQYVKWIFGKYEDYIRYSASCIELVASESTTAAIYGLADELQEKTEQLSAGELEEVRYIEDCMWICLEAMIKLLAVSASRVVGEDYRELAQAMTAYAFEYGRYMLYSRELEIVNEFIQSQHELDAALERKYAAFIADLEEESAKFYTLIDNAFVPDFRESFLHSIALAKAAGVDEREVLTSLDDVDEFFM